MSYVGRLYETVQLVVQLVLLFFCYSGFVSCGRQQAGPVPNVPTIGWLIWSLVEEQYGAVGTVYGGLELVWPGGKEVTILYSTTHIFFIVFLLNLLSVRKG